MIKKRITVVTTVVMLLLLALPLWAGGKQEAAAAAVKIKFWTHNRHNAALADAMVVKFNKEHPAIQVELSRYTDNFDQILGLAFEKGEGPDVYTMGSIDVNAYLAQGRIADLYPLLEPRQLKLFQDAAVLVKGSTIIQDKLVGLPAAGRYFRLYYSKDFFRMAGMDPEKPPLSFDETVSYAAKLTKAGASSSPKKYGYALAGGYSDVWAQNCDYVSSRSAISYYDYKNGKFTYKEQQPLLEMYLRLVKDGSVLPGFMTMENDTARAQFAAGNVGMINGAAWDIGVYNRQFPAQIEFGICLFPTLDGKVKGKSYAYSRPEAFVNGLIKSESKRKAAAQWLFFRSSPEWQQGDFENGFGVPVLPGILDKNKTFPNIKGWDHFKNLEGDAFFPPRPDPGLNVIGDTRHEVYNAVLAQKVADIGPALADLDTRYNEAQQKAVTAGKRDMSLYLVPDFDPMHPLGKGKK